jgi:hypothetical protein
MPALGMVQVGLRGSLQRDSPSLVRESLNSPRLSGLALSGCWDFQNSVFLQSSLSKRRGRVNFLSGVSLG